MVATVKRSHTTCKNEMQAHPQATSCTILCGLSAAAHASQPSTMLGANAYNEYANALSEVTSLTGCTLACLTLTCCAATACSLAFLH